MPLTRYRTLQTYMVLRHDWMEMKIDKHVHYGYLQTIERMPHSKCLELHSHKKKLAVLYFHNIGAHKIQNYIE